MGADVFQGAQDVGWNGGRSGQVVAHRMVALLVGRIGQRDVLALGRHIGHGTAGAVGIARLLDLDAIAGLVGELIVSLGVGGIVLEATDLGILVDIVGAGAADECQTEKLCENNMTVSRDHPENEEQVLPLTYLYILLGISLGFLKADAVMMLLAVQLFNSISSSASFIWMR